MIILFWIAIMSICLCTTVTVSSLYGGREDPVTLTVSAIFFPVAILYFYFTVLTWQAF